MKEFLIKPLLYFRNKQFLSLYTLKYLSQFPSDYFISNNTTVYMVHFYEKGKGTYRINDRNIDVTAGCALFCTMESIKKFTTSKDCEGFGLIFSESFFGKTSIKSFFLQHTLLFNSIEQITVFSVEERGHELLMIFQLMIEQLRRPYTDVQEQVLLNYVFTILLICEDLFSKDRSTLRIANDIKLIKNFKSLVNKEINRRHSVRFFSDQMNVSSSTLDRAFRKYENSSPKKWINKRLVKEIQLELRSKDMSIGEIAFKFGFSELTNFTKFFKGQTGITPKQFRSK